MQLSQPKAGSGSSSLVWLIFRDIGDEIRPPARLISIPRTTRRLPSHFHLGSNLIPRENGGTSRRLWPGGTEILARALRNFHRNLCCKPEHVALLEPAFVRRISVTVRRHVVGDTP